MSTTASASAMYVIRFVIVFFVIGFLTQGSVKIHEVFDAVASSIGAFTDAVKLPRRLTRGDQQARREHRDVHDEGFRLLVC